jgi:uncharacterized repeat protein (TIGR03803 family)
MTRSQQNSSSVSARLVVTVGLFILFVAAIAAHAQTYTIIHKFTNGSDGSLPTSTLVPDRAGNMYGTTENGGTQSGVLFQLKRAGSGWILVPLHDFALPNGDQPLNYGGLTFGPDGAIYGTTYYGGLLECGEGQSYCGVAFRLQPPPTACTSALCPWDYSLVYQFTSSGANGPEGSLVFDTAGNLYGTGSAIYELSPSGGSWNESVIPGVDNYVTAGMIVDSAGNLYGTSWDYHSGGTVFELSPSSSGWTETTLYSFTGGGDGSTPVGGLVFDSAGNLYGSTTNGGSGGGGTVFELSPSGGGWVFNLICSLQGPVNSGPQSALTLDGQGNLYGTTYNGGAHSGGSVFKATRSGNNWACSDLHDFEQDGNGASPIAGVTVDANGNLYGTTTTGGGSRNCSGGLGCGVIWEIAP